VFFFFSSRRRHTRFSRDWSSDVCSSDLEIMVAHGEHQNVLARLLAGEGGKVDLPAILAGGHDAGDALGECGHGNLLLVALTMRRSEERRVGKECRCEW